MYHVADGNCWIWHVEWWQLQMSTPLYDFYQTRFYLFSFPCQLIQLKCYKSGKSHIITVDISSTRTLRPSWLREIPQLRNSIHALLRGRSCITWILNVKEHPVYMIKPDVGRCHIRQRMAQSVLPYMVKCNKTWNIYKGRKQSIMSG